jgi:hypothetical protein
MIKSLLLTSEVIARRLPLLAEEAVMPRPGRRESERMVSEKVAALSEGMVEASFAAMKLNMLGSVMLMTGDAAGLARLARQTPNDLAKAFTGPGRKRLRANARRLRKGA